MAYRGTISWRSGVTVFKYYSLSSGRIDLGFLSNLSRIRKAVALYSGAEGASCCENRTPDVTEKNGAYDSSGKGGIPCGGIATRCADGSKKDGSTRKSIRDRRR